MRWRRARTPSRLDGRCLRGYPEAGTTAHHEWRERDPALRAAQRTHDGTGRDGGEAQNREGRADFRAYLTGRVAWVAHLDPERGRRLRADLDRIVWT